MAIVWIIIFGSTSPAKPSNSRTSLNAALSVTRSQNKLKVILFYSDRNFNHLMCNMVHFRQFRAQGGASSVHCLEASCCLSSISLSHAYFMNRHQNGNESIRIRSATGHQQLRVTSPRKPKRVIIRRTRNCRCTGLECEKIFYNRNHLRAAAIRSPLAVPVGFRTVGCTQS